MNTRKSTEARELARERRLNERERCTARRTARHHKRTERFAFGGTK
jgi:hypothetical protein